MLEAMQGHGFSDVRQNRFIQLLPLCLNGAVQDDAHDAEIELPDLDSPVPSSWKTLEGPFFNVYALKQVSTKSRLFFIWKNVLFLLDRRNHDIVAFWILREEQTS